jgi:hypothetical protein
MIKSDSLLLLINSMSKSEKRAFVSQTEKNSFQPGYMFLYSLVIHNKSITASSLKQQFLSSHPKASYDTTVKYLYKLILDVLLELREEQDSYFTLFNKILKARVLFEKSLYEECFDILGKVAVNAKKSENYIALYLASRLELDYLLTLNLPEISEKTLLNKHFHINETIRIIQKLNQQSSLYELLKHRLIYKGSIRTEKQKAELNDLVVSELSLSASSNLENFEIKKLHQLFQANYLISVGDYKSAVRSFQVLNKLFESHLDQLSTPPIYYLLNLEGVLESMRSIGKYDNMEYFINQLRLIKSPSVNFQANVTSLIFIYEIICNLEQGNFTACAQIMTESYQINNENMNMLTIQRRAEFCIYSTLAWFVLKEYRKARKALNQLYILGNKNYNRPLNRTIRLINLMMLYELKDNDLIKYESRSIRRDMNGLESGYRIERCMLGFVNIRNFPVTPAGREKLWSKMEPELDKIRNDTYERQVLRVFDFTAWIESKIRRTSLSEIMKESKTRRLSIKIMN